MPRKKNLIHLVSLGGAAGRATGHASNTRGILRLFLALAEVSGSRGREKGDGGRGPWAPQTGAFGAAVPSAKQTKRGGASNGAKPDRSWAGTMRGDQWRARGAVGYRIGERETQGGPNGSLDVFQDAE